MGYVGVVHVIPTMSGLICLSVDWNSSLVLFEQSMILVSQRSLIDAAIHASPSGGIMFRTWRMLEVPPTASDSEKNGDTRRPFIEVVTIRMFILFSKS